MEDGVNALTAASFFKSLKEESGMDDVVGTLGKSYTWESVEGPKSTRKELEDLEKKISAKMAKEWREILKLAGVGKDEEGYERRKRALVLLYAHFLRLDVEGASLQRGSFVPSITFFAFWNSFDLDANRTSPPSSSNTQTT